MSSKKKKENGKYCLDVTYNILAVSGQQVFREYFATKKNLEKFKKLVDRGYDREAINLIEDSIFLSQDVEVLDVTPVDCEEVLDNE